MNKAMNKSYESTISTTGTTGTPQFSDTMENNVKYMNLNFVDNSESSSQVKDVPVDYQKLQTLAFEAPKLNKPLPSKILPTSMPFSSKHEHHKPKTEAILNDKTLVEMGFKSNEIQGWENIVQPPKENLYKLLRNMIDNHIKPNVQIRIGGVTFNCHMMVLQCYSDFFMECNNEVLIQLPEEKITPGAFMMVYDWMLAEEPLVQREGILELFNAANFLRIKDLINQCWLCLDDDVRFREDTAFLLYLEARSYGLESLEQLMLTRICKFFLTLVASKEYLQLNAKEICTLLTSNTIGVNSEIEIFMSVVRWLSHDWEQREGDMLSVVKCVRFSLMPPWFLVTLNKTTDCEEIDRVACHSEVKKMINDGISFTTTQLYYGENREEFLHFLERYQLIAPMQRQWVFDKECTYHHRLECPNMQYVTYKSFLDYLEMIQTIGKDYWHSLEMARSSEKSLQCCVRTDARKANDKNVASVYTRKASRDQSVQVEAGVRQRKTLARDLRTTIINREHKASIRRAALHANRKYDGTTTSTEASEYNHLHENEEEVSCVHRQHYQKQQQEHKEQQYRTQNHHKSTNKVEHMQHDSECPTRQKDPLQKQPQHGQRQQQQTQQHQQQQQQQRNHAHFNDEADHQSLKSNENATNNLLAVGEGQQVLFGDSSTMLPILKGTEGDGEKSNEQALVQIYKHNISTCSAVDFNQVTSQKILVIGGIDPYCQHCMRQDAAQQQRHRRLLRSESSSSISSAEMEVAGIIAGADEDGANEIENYGDQVLFCDAKSLQWKHLSHIPFGSRHHHAAVVCNGQIYIVGGTRTALGCTKKSVFEKSVWKFDPKTLKWTIECNLPESRRDFGVVAIDGRCERCPKSSKRGNKAFGIGFFVIGGEGINGIALDSVWFYDVLRKIWTKKASLNVGRYGFATVMVNNEIWIAGGIINDRISTSFGPGGDSCGETKKTTADVITDSLEYYSLKCADSGVGAGAMGPCGFCDVEGGGLWKRSKLHLRVPRLFGKFCKVSSTKLYIVGGIGFSSDDLLTSLASVDYFDFNTAKWQHCGDISSARHGHDVAALNELIVVIGGVSTIKKRTLTEVDAFCTRTRKPLKDMPDLPWPLSGSAVITLD